jgi:muconolactone delta-isomerase
VADVITVAPQLAMTLTAYDEFKSMLPDDRETRGAWWYGLAKLGTGTAACLVGQLIPYPLDTIKRRMQADHRPGVHHLSYGQCIKHLWREAGIWSFYRGIGIQCVKTVPAAAMQLALFDSFKYVMLLIDPSSSSPL